MVRLIALFTHPDDPGEFDHQFDRQFLPLARRLPGLARLEMARVFGAPYGQPPYHRMVDLYFADRAALAAALASDVYRELQQAPPVAAGLATIVFAEGGQTHRD